LSGLLKIIHSNVFISCFLEIIVLSSSHALDINILSLVHALEISILSFGVNDSLGAPEVHPMGVAPELLSGLMKIIHSKVFISCF
jgi:hypothetical protein